MPIIVPSQGVPGFAASTSGALKAFIESQGLGVSVYRDQAPANTPAPYLTVSEAMAIVPDSLEDGVASTAREHATVDIWMEWKNLRSVVFNGVKPGGLLETYSLPNAVVKALQGSQLMTSGSSKPPQTVYGVFINNAGPRIVAIDANRVHFPIWVEVWRAL